MVSTILSCLTFIPSLTALSLASQGQWGTSGVSRVCTVVSELLLTQFYRYHFRHHLQVSHSKLWQECHDHRHHHHRSAVGALLDSTDSQRPDWRSLEGDASSVVVAVVRGIQLLCIALLIMSFRGAKVRGVMNNKCYDYFSNACCLLFACPCPVGVSEDRLATDTAISRRYLCTKSRESYKIAVWEHMCLSRCIVRHVRATSIVATLEIVIFPSHKAGICFLAWKNGAEIHRHRSHGQYRVYACRYRPSHASEACFGGVCVELLYI